MYPYDNFGNYNPDWTYRPKSTERSTTNKIFVNGIEDVRNIMSPPGTDMIYLDTNLPKLYCKMVDNYGGVTIDVYNITKEGGAPDKDTLADILDRLTKLEQASKSATPQE